MKLLSRGVLRFGRGDCFARSCRAGTEAEALKRWGTVVQRCRGDQREVLSCLQRWWCIVHHAEVLSWWRGLAEVVLQVQRFCRG